MDISVLMTVYNDEKYLNKSIESILNQSFRGFEFIIINDGSTDSTTDILNYYSSIDSRIRVFHKTNTGMTKALNFGLSISQGKYIARMDSDDISFPKRLEIEFEFLENNPDIDLIGGAAQIIDDMDNVIGLRNIGVKNPKKTLSHQNIFQHTDIMFRRSILKKVIGYREKFRNAQDYDLWLRISDVSEIAKIPDILGQWRLNAGGYTIARNYEQNTETNVIKKFHQQRLQKGYDDYEQYSPKPPVIHGIKIDKDRYNYIVGCHMVHSLQQKEGRNKIIPYMIKTKSIHSILIIIISYFPKSIIKFLYYLNDKIKILFN